MKKPKIYKVTYSLNITARDEYMAQCIFSNVCRGNPYHPFRGLKVKQVKAKLFKGFKIL